MKPLYVICSLVGSIVPVIWVYVVHLPHGLVGFSIDLGLFLFSLGLGLIFMPLGVVAGLFIAAAIHFFWSLYSRRSHYSG